MSRPPLLTHVLPRYLAPWVVRSSRCSPRSSDLANFRRDLRGLRASHQADHVIVCGIGEIGLQIVENLCDAGENVVAIDLTDDSASALTAERLGATVLKGNATHLSVLQSGGLSGAKIVVICTGQDADNVDIALRVKGTITGGAGLREKPLLVLVELRDEWLFGRLIDHDQEALGSAACEIRLFNTYQNTARLLLQTIPPPLATADKVGTFVIVGFGSMGREVAHQILAAALTPLDQTARVLIVDRKAEAMEKQFRQRRADRQICDGQVSPPISTTTRRIIGTSSSKPCAEDAPFRRATRLPEDRRACMSA